MNAKAISSACLLLILLSFCHPDITQAQQEDQYRVETVDGNVFVGTLISEDEGKVVIRTESLGEITIRRENIRSMERLREGDYSVENPQPTRYLLAPNAIGLQKGRGYYQNTWIFFNNVNYGISNNFSMGIGMVPLFLLGVPGTPVWVLPKVSVPLAKNNIHLAAGAMLGGGIGTEGESGGILYGASTIGNTNTNLTVGLGYGYSGGSISSSPMLNISGITRIGQTTYLISENYFFPETNFNGLASIGVRWAPENFALDFALVRPLEDLGGLIGIPWLGVSIPLGE